MKTSAFFVAFFLGCLIASVSLVSATNAENNLTVKAKQNQYLVYVNYPDGVNHQTFDNTILTQALGSKEAAKKALVYHYDTVMSGFSASLTPSQVELIKKNPNVDQVVEAKANMKILEDFNSSKRRREDEWDQIVLFYVQLLNEVFCLWPFC